MREGENDKVTEYIVIKAPDGGSGADYVRLWLNRNSAVGRVLICTYSERDELYFVFRLVTITTPRGEGSVVE